MIESDQLTDLLGEETARAIAFVFEGDVLQLRPRTGPRVAALGHVGSVPVYSYGKREVKFARERAARLAKRKQAAEYAADPTLGMYRLPHQCTQCGTLNRDLAPAAGTRVGLGGMRAVDCPKCGNRDIAHSGTGI